MTVSCCRNHQHHFLSLGHNFPQKVEAYDVLLQQPNVSKFSCSSVSSWFHTSEIPAKLSSSLHMIILVSFMKTETREYLSFWSLKHQINDVRVKKSFQSSLLSASFLCCHTFDTLLRFFFFLLFKVKNAAVSPHSVLLFWRSLIGK